ncbi:hypothetical protein Tco_1211532 [Tanacetum coccineum]
METENQSLVECESPLNGGFCLFCNSRAGNSFTYDSTPNSFDNPPNFSYPPPQPQYDTYFCELCGNDAHYGYDCPPQVPFVYNPDPCFNQNFDTFPQTSPTFPQQYLCCENCGGPHATFECQPMNQNFYNSNSFGFDQSQPPQFPVIHQPRQETSAEMLHAREDLMESIQNFLKRFDRISFRETPKVLTQAWDKFFEVKHAQSEEVQELLSKLVQDLQSINEELAEYINTPSWNLPTSSYDDDEEYTIAITPNLSTEEPDNSLSMGDEHLDTIPETESDEVIKSSVEDLVPIPNQFEGFSDSNDDSTSIDDDSFSIDDIDYVEASPPDSELVSLEEVKDFHTEDGEIEDDILREKLSKINLLIAKIEAINSNPPPSSDFVTKSPSTFPNSFLEETNTFDNSIPESETFCFDLEENSSGSTTTRSDYSLPDYEAFYFDDDHIEEKSSGSTTTHSDISLSKYDSFIFDLSNDPFPPADRSDFYHEEFADELAPHSPPIGNACPLTRITTTTEVPLRIPTALDNETYKPVVTLVYSRKPRKSKTNVLVSKSKVVQIVLWYLESGFSKHMTEDRSQLTNFVNKFLGTVKFGNDHVAKILGYGDYQIGNVMISRVYYVEGLGHNLFSVGQFYDSNLEVAFRQHTCFIRNLEGVDLLTSSRGNNL